MIDLFVMIGVCFFLANQIELRSKQYISVQDAVKKDWSVKILYFILLLIVILFSGLRTTYNDTETYMQGYQMLNVNDKNVFSFFEPYGGFTILQTLLKKYISENPQILILVSSIIVNTIFLYFYSKYSKCFELTIFSYLILGPYVFSMGGIKQALAMGLSLVAIDNLLQKKYFKFVFWLLIAMAFHPYIICMAIIPLFTEGIWNKKMAIVLVIAVLVSMNLEPLLNFAGILGKDYSVEEMMSHTVNPMRVLVEIVPVIFSWVCRKRINREEDKLLLLGVNMMIINAFMISLGLFFNPIYFARIGTYFSVLNAITIPTMLNVMYQGNPHRRKNILIYYSFYFVYFVLDLTKLGTFSITYDLFNHIKIF